jgi:CRP/FNR family transcriptional regulator
VRSGALKSLSPDGHPRVVGYYVVGDVLGLAGLATGAHADDAVACEAAEVAELPYADIARLARDIPDLHKSLTRLLAVSTGPTIDVPARVGIDEARCRLAHLILRIAERLARRGYAATVFSVALADDELASLLGVTEQFVVEAFDTLAKDGLAERVGRDVAVLSVPGLEALAAKVGVALWQLHQPRRPT